MNSQMPASEHQSLLNSLPGKIAHIYDKDSIDSILKHDIVCRLIAQSIGANSVSILLYYGPKNYLYCAGRYIDPMLVNAKSVNEDASGTAIINVMKCIDIIEFLKISKPELTLYHFSLEYTQKLYEDYCSFEFSNPDKLSFDIFHAILKICTNVKDKVKFDQDYSSYSETIRSDSYRIINPKYARHENDKSVTGTYYYALTHCKNQNEFELFFADNNNITIGPDHVIVASLKEYTFRRISTSTLRDRCKVEINSDATYIGIPLIANGRPIGILRLSLNENIKVTLPSHVVVDYNCKTHGEFINYIKKTVNIQALSYMFSLLIDNHLFEEGIRAISLKDSLKGNIKNLHGIANELTKVINCYGCIIRLSNSNGSNAEISGYSEGVFNYNDAIKSSKDPYITDKGTFVPALTKLLYKEKDGNNIDIECLKVDFDKDWRPSFSFFYLDNNSKWIVSEDLQGLLSANSNTRKELISIFSPANKFKEYNLKSIIHIPIKDWEYGLITFANRSNRAFLTKDIEMMKPVVTRLGLALKYDSDLSIAENKNKDEIFHSQRLLYHQMLSPIVSMRNSFVYLKMFVNGDSIIADSFNIERSTRIPEKISKAEKNRLETDKKAFDLRMEEIVHALETTIDFVRVSQFVSNYLHDKGSVVLNLETISLSKFIIDKARTYQPHAKLHRGVDIHVDIVDSKYPRINTDPLLLTHIMQALIDNAIKYSYNHIKGRYADSKNPIYAPEGVQNKIFIIVEYFEKERSYTITVENWGLKIKNEEKTELTGFLKRGSEAKVFDTNGTGIGLFVVKTLAEALNGKLEINPEKEDNLIQRNEKSDIIRVDVGLAKKQEERTRISVKFYY